MIDEGDVHEQRLREQLAELVAEVGPARSRALLEELLPDPLQRVARGVSAATDVESLARPLLQTLHDLTGMSSTYLTVVHQDHEEQEVRFSANARDGFEVPEGLRVAWPDTLCMRALSEGRPWTDDVPSAWPDSAVAAAMGIQTYVSVPVRLADGSLWGTLCGADSVAVADAERHLPTMGMFARLIAAEVERASVLAEARLAAERDPLTGCANRHGLEQWLAWAQASGAERIAAVYVDLDRFKAVNDEHGHAAGDEVLCALARELRGRSRDEDLVGRLGGDEFVVVAALEQERVPGFLERWEDTLAVDVVAGGVRLRVEASLGTAHVPASDAALLLQKADRAMYAVKRAAGQGGR